jgi:hypothetical protein
VWDLTCESVSQHTFSHSLRRGSDSRYIPISVFEARSHSACVLFRTFVVSPTAASLSQYQVIGCRHAGWQIKLSPQKGQQKTQWHFFLDP